MFFGSLLTVARPYAKAAFDFSCEHQVIKKWKLMFMYAKDIVEDPTIRKLLSSKDYIGYLELSKMFIVIAQDNFDIFFCNFIRVLAEYKRLCLISIIFDEFLFLCRKKEMIMEVKVITPLLLSNDEIFKITSVMRKKFLRKIKIICELDQSIIGGVIFRINNFVLDGSIRRRIERLKFILEM